MSSSRFRQGCDAGGAADGLGGVPGGPVVGAGPGSGWASWSPGAAAGPSVVTIGTTSGGVADASAEASERRSPVFAMLVLPLSAVASLRGFEGTVRSSAPWDHHAGQLETIGESRRFRMN